MIFREGESKKVWFRTDRCFRVGDQWYVATREGKDVGPYSSRIEAERSVPRYVKIMKQDSRYDMYARKLALNGIWASNDYA